MNFVRKSFFIITLMFSMHILRAQTENRAFGIWYMYAFNLDFNNSLWGIQGDLQYRNWNISNDIEQILLRGGVHFTPKNTRLKCTAGYAYLVSSPEDSKAYNAHENRIYEEIRFTHIVGHKFHLSHRFRFEQRFITNDPYKTRIRYAIGMDIPLNHTLIVPKTWYLTVNNELFLNGRKTREANTDVGLYDRNRTLIGIGYATSPSIKIVLGAMRQVSNFSKKTQLQISLIQTF